MTHEQKQQALFNWADSDGNGTLSLDDLNRLQRTIDGSELDEATWARIAKALGFEPAAGMNRAAFAKACSDEARVDSDYRALCENAADAKSKDDLSTPQATYMAWKKAIRREDVDGFIRVWATSARESFKTRAEQHGIGVTDLAKFMCSQLNESFSLGVDMQLDQCVNDEATTKSYTILLTLNGEPQGTGNAEEQSFYQEGDAWLMLAKS